MNKLDCFFSAQVPKTFQFSYSQYGVNTPESYIVGPSVVQDGWLGHEVGSLVMVETYRDGYRDVWVLGSENLEDRYACKVEVLRQYSRLYDC